MKPLSFKEFMAQQESSPFTRARHQWLMGLGPDMPDAAIFSRSTADPREVEYHDKEVKGKKKKKRKRKRKKKGKKIKEASDPALHPEVDKWLQAVDQLKKDLGQVGEEEADEEEEGFKDFEGPEEEEDFDDDQYDMDFLPDEEAEEEEGRAEGEDDPSRFDSFTDTPEMS
jgi:hypothetical protein